MSWTGGATVFGSPGIDVTEAGGGSSAPLRPQADMALTIAIDIRIVDNRERLVIVDPVVRNGSAMSKAFLVQIEAVLFLGWRDNSRGRWRSRCLSTSDAT